MVYVINFVLFVTLCVILAIGFLVMKKARSEHRQKNRLEKLNTDLTDLDAKKNEFLSLATHQLRSPLTSIKWGLSSLKEKFSLNTVEHLLETTDDLISTVNDLLDISKIEQGGMVMKFEEFDLHDFVGRLAEEFRMTAEAKGLRLVFSGENTPCFVIADQNKLRQVFVNLIDNAVKYTKEGTIDVLFQKTSKEAIVSVSDTGPGISKEELSCLFDKFLRGAAGRASSGGSGLGLYLAKKIVQEHKGSIKANSKGLGYGSVFVVRLPIK